MARDDYGPAMASLPPKRRRFVECYVEAPTSSGAEAARRAGYSDHLEAAKVQAHRILHDPRVAAAIEEVTKARMRYAGAIGVAALIKLAADPTHTDHFKAAVALADRSGFAPRTEHKVTVEHVDHGRMVEIAGRLARELGLDEMKLIGSNLEVARPGMVGRSKALRGEAWDFVEGEAATTGEVAVDNREMVEKDNE